MKPRDTAAEMLPCCTAEYSSFLNSLQNPSLELELSNSEKKNNKKTQDVPHHPTAESSGTSGVPSRQPQQVTQRLLPGGVLPAALCRSVQENRTVRAGLPGAQEIYDHHTGETRTA